MKAFLKYPGGKQRETDIIKKELPTKIRNYIEPFVGGGSVLLAMPSGIDKYYINDKSTDLINLYRFLKQQNELFFYELEKINYNIKGITKFIGGVDLETLKALFYEYKFNKSITYSIAFVDSLTLNLTLDNVDKFKNITYKTLINKLKLIEKLEAKTNTLVTDIDLMKNVRTGLTSGLYTYYRFIYNKMNISNEKKTAIFYYIRDFCYSSMFRYNKQGEFNVPYGGISYDTKNLDVKIQFLKHENVIGRLMCTEIFNDDFENIFNQINLSEDDFIFLDPPYDTDFSTYDNNAFDENDHIRLRDACKKTKAKFLLIIKETDFIKELYKDFSITQFSKKYIVSFKNRNNKNTEHLIIKNY